MEISIRACPAREHELEYFVKKYGFLLEDSNSRFELYLNLDRLELVQSNSQTKPLSIDFNSAKLQYRHKNIKQELINKAIGKKNKNMNIIDATAGLAQDAFLLASLGHNLTLIERSNIVAALLDDAIRQSKSNLKLIYGDALAVLKEINPKPEIIYLDPMYPKTNKKAAQKKGMQFFREILKDDDNSHKLLEQALITATKRVIVKRPIKADYLNNKKPAAQIKGKTTRFDIYLKN